ncbi:MAG: VWA domain-containing protein, partial [Lutibacter sp.]|nr:VWA domain-containing protein [Lutibacter sp.]
VKVFEDERELTMMLMVDISGSEFFGTTQQFKRDTITEIAATLAFSATQNNDKVGLLLFSDNVELFIPPKKGKSHVLRIIRELIEFQPKSTKTNISEALKFLSGVIKKKAIVFMLSDFMDENYEQTLKIAGKKHDVTGIRVYDKHDVSIPNLGMVPMLDAETGKTLLVNTASKSVRNGYEAYYLKTVDYFEKSFSHSGSGAISARIDESYVKKLLGYFKHKGAR